MATTTKPKGPFRLMTVNNAPERAYRLVGRVAKALENDYNVQHVANSESIEQVRKTATESQPDVVFAASMWTPEQVTEIEATVRSVRPNVKFFAIPQGLQVAKGPDAVVEHLIQHVPPILEK